MITAIKTVHWEKGVWVSAGGYEYNLVLLAAVFGLTENGPGKWSVDGALGRSHWGTGWALAALARERPARQQCSPRPSRRRRRRWSTLRPTASPLPLPRSRRRLGSGREWPQAANAARASDSPAISDCNHSLCPAETSWLAWASVRECHPSIRK